jgi:hypothetical protein
MPLGSTNQPIVCSQEYIGIALFGASEVECVNARYSK